jgi:hypothetical protein
MNSPNYQEHRHLKRYGVMGCAVQYKPLRWFGARGPLSSKHIVLDISEEGLQFISREAFKTSTKLLMTITAPFLNGYPIHTIGRVLWTKQAVDLPLYVMGIGFVSMQSEDTLRLKTIMTHSVEQHKKIS